MPFQLPALPYAHNALEPHIDTRTMEIHHGKHHNAYVTNLNKAIEGTPLDGKTIEDILKGLDMTNMAVRNNGGGHYNHSLFWTIMAPNGGGYPTGDLATAIDRGLRLLRGASRRSSQQPAPRASAAAGPGCACTRAASWRSAPPPTRTIR